MEGIVVGSGVLAFADKSIVEALMKKRFLIAFDNKRKTVGSGDESDFIASVVNKRASGVEQLRYLLDEIGNTQMAWVDYVFVIRHGRKNCFSWLNYSIIRYPHYIILYFH